MIEENRTAAEAPQFRDPDDREADQITVESAAPVSQYPGVGSMIGGYEVTGVVASGGMGIVYRAVDHNLDRELAVKVISPSLAHDERFRKRFVTEARVVANLKSPHILPVFRAGEDDGLLYLVTPLVETGDLKALLANTEPLSPDQVVSVVSQVAAALDTAHRQGLVHRDVKPANVLVERADTGFQCYLADFGIARSPGLEPGITGTGEVLGTVDYLAPEVIEGLTADRRADVYALGCMAIELLTGKPPFRRVTRRDTMIAHLHEDAVIDVLPSELDQERAISALGCAIAKDPTRRYSTCSNFAKALADSQAATGEREAPAITIPAGAGPTNLAAAQPAKRSSGRWKAAAVLVGAILLIAGGTATGYKLSGETFNVPEHRGDSAASVSDEAPSPQTVASDTDPPINTASPNRDSGSSAGPGSVPVTHLFESGDLDDSGLIRSSNLYTLDEFTSAEGRYARVGGQGVEQGLAFELSAFEPNQQVRFPVDQNMTRFFTRLGVENNVPKSQAVSATFVASDGVGVVAKQSVGRMIAGQPLRSVDLDISDATELIIKFRLEPMENEAMPLVVLADPKFG